MRLITRKGNDCTGRYPWIVESALKSRQKHFVVDREAVVLCADGIPDFNALHCRKRDAEVQLYAFDCLAVAGEDTRHLPLSMRKTNLEQLVAPSLDGISVAPFDQGEIGPDLFRPPATWGLRAWSRSEPIGPIVPDARRTG